MYTKKIIKKNEEKRFYRLRINFFSHCPSISTSTDTESYLAFSEMIIFQENVISIKEEESLDLTVKSLMTTSSLLSPDKCESPSPPHSAAQQLQMLTTSMLPTQGGQTPLNLLVSFAKLSSSSSQI